MDRGSSLLWQGRQCPATRRLRRREVHVGSSYRKQQHPHNRFIWPERPGDHDGGQWFHRPESCAFKSPDGRKFLRWVAERRTVAPYTFGAGGGRSRAAQAEANPTRRCEPSQNGLFSECPQRHSPRAVRPPKPNGFPSASQISNSPSTRIEPLLLIVILAGILFKPNTPWSAHSCVPRRHSRQRSAGSGEHAK